jgi:dephospho-CoA kinase
MALVKMTRPDAVQVLDIPLLYEARLDKLCDQVSVVWVDRETQVKRLMERNGYTRKEALERIGSQMSLDEKAKRAQVVFDNTGTLDETLEMVERYFTNVLTNS